MLLLAVFGGVCLWNLGAYEMLIWDEAEYACLGRSLAHGEGYRISGETHAIRPPLLPAAIAASMLVFGRESDRIAKLPSVLFAMLTLAVVYGAVWLESGAGPAFLASWSLALAPEFLSPAVMLLSETPFLTFYTAALVAFYLGFHRHKWWLHLGWAAFALALSTRYTALLFGPTLLLLFGYEWFRDRANVLRLLETRTFWLAPLWAAGILGPWLYRQWLVTSDPLFGVRYASNQIPDYALAVMPWHFYLTSLPAAMTWPVALAGVAGLAAAVWKGRALGIYAAIAALVILGWHTQYDYKEVRLVAAVFPLLAIGVGLGTQIWMERFESLGRFRVFAIATAMLAIATTLSFLEVGRSFRYRVALGEPSFLEAMAYVRNNSAPDAVLIAPNVAQVHWYSGRMTRETPETPEELLEALPEAHWVVITNFERGQADYAFALAEHLKMADQLTGDVHVFRDSQFATLLAGPEWVRRRLSEAR